MTDYFMDTTVLVAISNKCDKHHDKAKRLVRAILKEKTHPTIFVSDYIIDETISVVLARTKNEPDEFKRKILEHIDKIVYNSRFIRVIHVDEVTYSSALTYLRKEKTFLASLTDWINAVTMKSRNIKEILSFDGDFDKISKLPDFSFIKRIEEL